MGRKKNYPEMKEVPEIPDRIRRGQSTSLAILDKKEQIQAAYKAMSKDDFMVFCRGLTIASQTGPRVFENCMAAYQRTVFEDIAPNIMLLRDGQMPAIKRFWWERTKKASKDADLAIVVMWLVAFPTRPFYGQIGAADRSQAGIVKERMSHLLHHNPWLNDHVEMINNEVRSKKLMANRKPMAKFDIMSSDVAGAHGGTPDILIVNELSHIQKWEFVENLISNAAGVDQGIVIIATNAGFLGTPAEVMRRHAIRSDDWSVHVLAKPAPWTNRKTLQDEKATLKPSRYKRLWWGKWASGKGDALQEESINRCFVLDGPLLRPEKNWVYFLGLDLGISRDHAGLVALGVNLALRKIRLAYMKGWEPVEQPNGSMEVDLISVMNECARVSKLFRAYALLFDPHQAVLMAQMLRKEHINMRPMEFTPANCNLMADRFMQAIENGILECFDDEEGRLRRDFGKFNIVEKQYGHKLEAVRDEFGHADVGTALIIVIPALVDWLEGIKDGLSPDDDLVDTSEDKELTEEEVNDLPDELKAIYGDHNQTAGKSHSELFENPNKKPKKPQLKGPLDDIE